MRNMKPVLYIVAAAALLGSCSEHAGEEGYTPVSPDQTRQITLRQTYGADASVLVFREEEGRFLYDTLFNGGWSPEGRMTVRLPNGEYRFLFSHGAGTNLALTPATPQKGVTAWEDISFTLAGNPSSGGSCMPADELYLQYPATDAEKVYSLRGAPQTVEAQLHRAVGQVGLILKRGYIEGGKYVELPYENSRNILEDAGSLTIEIDSSGKSVTPDGTSGTARILYSMERGSQKEITPEGFAKFDGPFIIPPADRQPVPIKVSVQPAPGSAMPASTLSMEGTVERNKRLEITLWFTSVYPEIGISIDTLPIEEVEYGDSGIWE